MEMWKRRGGEYSLFISLSLGLSFAGDIDMLMELSRVESSGDFELALGFAHVKYEWEILNFI